METPKKPAPGKSLVDRLRAQQQDPGAPPSSATEPSQPIPQPIQPEAVSPPAPPEEAEELPSPLWKSKWKAEYRMKPQDRRYHKSEVQLNPHYLGAMEAIARLQDRRQYKLYEEMMQAFLEKHRDLLEDNEDLVRLCEAPWRELFDL